MITATTFPFVANAARYSDRSQTTTQQTTNTDSTSAFWGLVGTMALGWLLFGDSSDDNTNSGGSNYQYREYSEPTNSSSVPSSSTPPIGGDTGLYGDCHYVGC